MMISSDGSCSSSDEVSLGSLKKIFKILREIRKFRFIDEYRTHIRDRRNSFMAPTDTENEKLSPSRNYSNDSFGNNSALSAAYSKKNRNFDRLM